MDISDNKLAKDFFKRQFKQVVKQLEGKDTCDLEGLEPQPIHLNMSVMKEKGAKRLVDMADFISSNPQITLTGFMLAGITRLLEGLENEDRGKMGTSKTESNSDTMMTLNWKMKKPTTYHNFEIICG